MGACQSSAGVSVLASSSDNTECRGLSDGSEPAAPFSPLASVRSAPRRAPSSVLGLVDGKPGYLDVKQWTSNLDVPVVK